MKEVALVESVGYFERFGLVVVKCENHFASSHVSFGPFRVFHWDLTTAHVVYDAGDDCIGEGTRNVEE